MSDNKAFSYLRTSGLGQEKGDGFARQRKAIEKYAKDNDVQVVKEVIDSGVSGTKESANRPGLAELMENLRQMPEVKLLLVENSERIGRALVVSEMIYMDLRELGVKCVACDSCTDLTVESDEPFAVCMRQFKSAMDQFERARIVYKLRVARERIRLKNGKCEGAKAYGSREGEAKILEGMKSLREQGISYFEIAFRANEQKLPTRHGKKWYETSVRRVLARIQGKNGVKAVRVLESSL